MIADTVPDGAIGTPTPTAKLQVNGDVKLGPTGQYYAPAAEEILRSGRGTVNANGGRNGSGFNVIHTPGSGVYIISMATKFAAEPSVTVTLKGATTNKLWHEVGAGPNYDITVATIVWGDAGYGLDTAFSFIAVGPR